MVKNRDNKFSAVIDKYRGTKPYRAFADEINGHLAAGRRLSYMHWMAICRGEYAPNWYVMDYLARFATGWVHEFAVAMRAELERSNEDR